MFDEDELKFLSMSVGVDYEILNATGKLGKAIELYKWCRNHGKIQLLTEEIRSERSFLFEDGGELSF